MTLRWRELSSAEAADWTPALLDAGASLYQLPFWNEACRAAAISPRYLMCEASKRAVAFVSVLSVGVSGLRLGLIRRGPVMLVSERADEQALLRTLIDWAREQRFVFLRFSHEDEARLRALSAAGPLERFEAFPFYRDLSEELIVPQASDEEEMLTRFGGMVGRWIRMAEAAGYRIEVHDSPERFKAVWPMFQRVAHEKRIRFRPLASWQTLIREGRRFDAVRVYTALFDEHPVETLLVVRDRMYAHAILGALHVTPVNGRVNPSFLLHWRAMRDARDHWGTHYNLNSRQPYSFKRQFHPIERKLPPPAVVTLRRSSYRLWRWSLRWSPSPRRLKRLLFR